MRRFIWFGLGVCGLGLAVSTACTPPLFCPYGVFPFDGATAVSPDVVIELWADALPAGLPVMDAAVRVTDLTSGLELPILAQADSASGVVEVVPLKPFVDGHVIQVEGLDRRALRAAEPHWGGDLPHDNVNWTFTVGGSPILLEAWSDTTDIVVVAFSQAMDLDSLEITLVDDGGDRIAAPVIGTVSGAPELVEVIRPESMSGPQQVLVHPDARSATGEPLALAPDAASDAGSSGTPDGTFSVFLLNNNSANTARYTRAPSCY